MRVGFYAWRDGAARARDAHAFAVANNATRIDLDLFAPAVHPTATRGVLDWLADWDAVGRWPLSAEERAGLSSLVVDGVMPEAGTATHLGERVAGIDWRRLLVEHADIERKVFGAILDAAGPQAVVEMPSGLTDLGGLLLGMLDQVVIVGDVPDPVRASMERNVGRER